MNQIRQSRDMTSSDLSGYMPNVKATGGLNVGFFYQRVPITSVASEKNGTYETRLCVAKQPKGDPRTLVHRFITPKQAAEDFPREYALFTQFEDVPAQGTALSELPGVSRSQIAMLEIAGLRCVEDLREISAEDAAQLGMDVSRARKVALAWLQKRDDESEMITAADVQTKAEAAIKAMTDRLEKIEQNAKRLEMENETLRKMSGRAAPGAAAFQPGPVDSAGPPLEIDPDDGFMAGSDVADGADDLGADVDPNPLED